RAHRRIAHFEIENLVRRRIWAESLERRLQRMSYDWLSQAARCVMAAGAATLVGWLQDRRAGRDLMLLRRAAFIDNRIERRCHIGDALRGFDRFGNARRGRRAVGFFLQELDAVLAFGGDKLLEIDVDRRVIVLAGPNGERAALCRFYDEAHDRLVDGADLLD